jgi:hypothetical protein
MTEAAITTATIPRSLLADVFTIAVLAQQRRDYCCNEAGKEFPSHTMLEFINAAEKIGLANVILVEDPPPIEPTEEVPWEKDSLAEDSVKSPCNVETGNAKLPPETTLE